MVMVRGKRKMERYHEMDEVKKGPWKPEEDQILINHVKKNGPRDWSSIRSKGLLKRTGKSCRLRWVNKLRPNLKNGVKFSPEEERTVIDLQAQFGNKWAKIATYLTGRTDNDVKNFWSSRKKRLSRIQGTPLMRPNKATESIQEVESPHFPVAPSTQAMSLNSSVSGTFEGAPLPELVQSISCFYGNTAFLPDFFDEKKSFSKPQHATLSLPSCSQMQQDFLGSQDGIARVGDPCFMDTFYQFSEQTSGFQIPFGFDINMNNRGNEVKIESFDMMSMDGFIDDFPPMDMFDEIEPLPSPSKWS